MQYHQANDQEWAKDIAVVVFYGIFGGLFYSFSNTPSRYSECKETQFLDWSSLTMIVCLTLVGISTVKLLFRICSVTQKCPALWASLESIGGIFVIICAIGLHVKYADACGDLSTLAMVFYILVYITLGIVLFLLCCTCCLGAGALATLAIQKNNEPEQQPINVVVEAGVPVGPQNDQYQPL